MTAAIASQRSRLRHILSGSTRRMRLLGQAHTSATSELWLFMDGSLPGGYRLVGPITVRVHREGDEYVAAVDQLPIHAFGATVVEATAALRDAIGRRVERLAELGERLSPAMQRDRDRLNAAVRKVHG
jgi:predicted RNase H-like HicB family nuclease